MTYGVTQTGGHWGRSIHPSWPDKLVVLSLITVCPFLGLFMVMTNTNYEGSVLNSLYALLTCDFFKNIPSYSSYLATILGFFIMFEYLLALIPDYFSKFLPNYKGGKQYGQKTPANHLLEYNINGLQSWVITNLLFIGFSYLNIIDPAMIAKNWAQFYIAANFIGALVTVLAYIKALTFPTYPDDDKYTDCWWYNLVMGIEFNPRFLNVDIKLFSNGRTGIIAWSIINYSFAAYQYQQFGFVSDSMILVNLLHMLYIVDFFWNEAWYLKTIDIAHDHYGWYLAWGTFVWLPFCYTLQGSYLMNHPVILGNTLFYTILVLGIFGYVIFRWTNYQKDYFRRSSNPSNCQIWFQPAKYLACQYSTKCGAVHTSNLLLSGFWGMARHMNYTGDIILSLCYCLACGFDNLLPYFYVIFMTILLMHRCIRDEDRCSRKYGYNWTIYCQIVQYRLIPGIF